MKKLHLRITLAALIFLGSCNPKITTSLSKSYAPLDYREEVVVIGLNQPEPDDAETLGQVKIGDTGFSTNCDYNVVIDKAKLEARKAGGNAIKIIKHIPPSIMGSSCHIITANILKISDIESLSFENNEYMEDVLSDVDYAILNVYRYSGAGAIVSYDLFLGDSIICRVQNNYKTTLHITKDGLNTLWARTESKDEIPIDIKIGQTYYLRCGIAMGAFVGRPKLELIDKKTGKAEFESFNAKNQ